MSSSRTDLTPNVFEAFAYRPAQFRAFFAYHDALVDGALVRIYADDPLLADQLATNHRVADLGPADRAMLDFAVELTESPGRVDSEDVDRLREYFPDEAVWDVASVVAFYNLSNRMAQVADLRPNEEFHTMGRANDTRDADDE